MPRFVRKRFSRSRFPVLGSIPGIHIKFNLKGEKEEHNEKEQHS